MSVFTFTFADMQEDAYKGSETRGFHEHNKSPLFVASSLALIASEVSEALEADRAGRKEDMPGELADIVLRTMDLAQHLGINLGQAIEAKNEFNKTRPYKHGNKLY